VSQALRDTVVLGVTTNIPYLQDICRHPVFEAGETHTQFLDEHMAGWRPSGDLTVADWLAVAAFESLSTAARGAEELAACGRFTDPWSVTEGCRNVP
jgi:acetyl/propionyl-CoA carboxylase alpha subunit